MTRNTKLRRSQLPEVVELIEALPRTERGKVDYRAMEEMAKSICHE